MKTMKAWGMNVRKRLAGWIWPEYVDLERKYGQLKVVLSEMHFCRARLAALFTVWGGGEKPMELRGEALRAKLSEVSRLLKDL